MRLVTYSAGGAPRVGVLQDGAVIAPFNDSNAPSELCDMLCLIEAGPEALARLREAAERARPEQRYALDAVRLHAPIPHPRANVMCLGFNYAEHVAETAESERLRSDLPEHPVVFTKAVGSVVGPFDDVPAHAELTRELDWEVELGVIIGVGGRGIPRQSALAHVFGYTVIDDLSARDLQTRHKQFFLGKSLDGACPMGPCILTADEVPDPQELGLRCRVNGVLKQDSSTRHMIFGVAEIIEVLSRGMTLYPGDVIATGTPSGVGFTREPPEYLAVGDLVECEIDGIGALRNRIVL